MLTGKTKNPGNIINNPAKSCYCWTKSVLPIIKGVTNINYHITLSYSAGHAFARNLWNLFDTAKLPYSF